MRTTKIRSLVAISNQTLSALYFKYERFRFLILLPNNNQTPQTNESTITDLQNVLAREFIALA